MSDFLIQLSANRRARNAITTLGLPIPLPEPLKRDLTPWRTLELMDLPVLVGFGPNPELDTALANALGPAGANPYFAAEHESAAFQAAGEAWGRPARLAPEGLRPRALVLDATGLSTPAELQALYAFFHPHLRSLARSGRAIVLTRPVSEARDALTAATRRAAEGFIRSLGRELGRKGSTAMLLEVATGAEDQLAPALRFLLSPRAAYLSGQPWRLDAHAHPSPARWQRPLTGKVALVTGSARGIGEATAKALAREGATVVVLDLPRDAAAGAAVADALGGHFFGADLAEAGAPERVAAWLTEKFGRLDILVNNAGITRDKTLANMKPALWDSVIDVNLAAMANLTEAVLPIMPEGGRIVCLSSIAGIAGNVGQTAYSTSKAGVIGFVAYQAPALAAKGIRINAVAPGFIETRLTAAIPVATREVARRLANLAQGGLPEDIAEVVTFLSSPGASGVNGQTLRVCGGSFVGA